MRARLFLLFGQIFDGLTFAAFFAIAPAAVLATYQQTEANPIAAAALAFGGVAAVLLIKVILVGAVFLLDKPTDRPKLVTIIMYVAGLSGYVGAVFNLVALRQVTG
jgi:hypothetical protein